MNLLDVRQYVVVWALLAGGLALLAATRVGRAIAVALALLVLFGTATLALGLRPVPRLVGAVAPIFGAREVTSP